MLFLEEMNCWFKLCLLLGGLAEEVDEKILQAAFIPFGDIIDINIPLDYETGLCVFLIQFIIYVINISKICQHYLNL